MMLGIDLGGTKIAYAVVVPGTSTIVARHVTETRSHEGAPAVLQRMIADCRDVCAAAGIHPAALSGIGIGVPGVFDDTTGCTLFLPNLHGTWPNVPVAQTLSDALGCSVWLINDARAFVLAEALHGAGRGADNIVGFTLGTGIGGGVVIGRDLYLGIDGTAGEFGHQTLALNGPRCGCGNIGCLEALASGPAIVAQATQLLEDGNAPHLAQALAKGDAFTPALVAQAANAGDGALVRLLDDVYAAIGAGVANVVTMFSPHVVVLGGSVSNLGTPLLAAVRQVVQQRCRATPIERIAIVPAVLGADAGMLGAAQWAFRRLQQREAP
jgi:glucokinase